MLRLRFSKSVAIIILSCFIGSLFEPVVAYAKKTPSWFPYWEVAGYRNKCDKGETGKWNSKYCECWMPLGWATEPIKYSSDDDDKPSQKQWRNAQFERYWKWWSRIRMNYNAMIRTQESDVKDTSASDKILQKSDELLRAANALCVADNFDNAFNIYFPDYVKFMSAEEEMRLLKQWIDLETAWLKSLNSSGLNYDNEAEIRNELQKLLWENEKAIATADDVLKEIIGFGLGGGLDKIFNAIQTMLDYFKDINKYIQNIIGEVTKVVQPLMDFIKNFTDVVNQLKDNLNGIKDKVKDVAHTIAAPVEWIPGLGNWIKEKLDGWIDDNLNIDSLVSEFTNSFKPQDFVNNIVDSFKKLGDLKIGDKTISDWKNLVEDVMSKINVTLDQIKGLIPLKAYNYGQTQALQAAGNQAAYMAMTMNRTNREINAFMEMQITAAHTQRAHREAVRNNMVIAGKNAQTSKAAKKVKLGFK